MDSLSLTRYVGILLFCLFPTMLWAQEGTATQDAADATLDFDMPFDDTPQGDVSQSSAETSGSRLQRAWDKVRFDFAYLAGSHLPDLSEVSSNRFDSRIRWDYLFGDSVFASVDGKVILRGWKDQQLSDDEKFGYNLRPKELAIQTTFKQYSIKAGFQTVIWGEMDSVSITDVLSPRDYSEFAFTSPEDARVGQPAIVTDLFLNKSQLQLVFVPLPLTNRFPGGDANGLLEFRLGNDQITVDDRPPQWGEDYEVGIRAKQNLGPSDVALFAAHAISDNPSFNPSSFTDEGIPTSFTTEYPKFELLGISANLSQANFLWKLETAFKNDLYFPTPSAILIRDTIETAFGFDYNANGAFDLSVELMDQYILPGDGNLVGVKPHNTQANLRWSKGFLHETITSIYFFSYGVQYGDITQSAAVSYAINDYWRFELNATLFQIKNQESPYKFVDDWDQVSVKLSLAI